MIHSRELFHWVYHFSLRRAGLSFAESDFTGCIHALRHAIAVAERRADHEMKVLLTSIKMHPPIPSSNLTNHLMFFPTSGLPAHRLDAILSRQPPI